MPDRPATRVFTVGDENPYVVAGNVNNIAAIIEEATGKFAAFDSYEPDDYTPRTIYVAADAVSGVIPMIPAEKRDYLDALTELYES